MRLDIFQDFELKTMLFDYSSFRFRRMFRGAGTFSLELHDLTEKEFFQEGTILLPVNSKDAWIIENIHSYVNVSREFTLELTGRHINALLERRVLESVTVNTTEPIEVQLRNLVAEHFIRPSNPDRGAVSFVLPDPKGITKMATKTYTLTEMTVLEALNRICGNSALGYRLNYLPEEQSFSFEVLEGQDITNQVIFSEEFGNLAEIEIYRESENYKNVALRNGQWEGTAAGLERREVLFQGEDDSLSDYTRVISVDSMVLDTEQFVYKKDWELGDTVTVVDKTLGFSVENPVLEIQETHAADVDLEVTFGDRLPNLF